MFYLSKHELSRLTRLAVPVVGAQIAQTLMGVVDTIMAGSVSPTDLAAVALAVSLWFPSQLMIQGVLMALAPLVSDAAGRQDGARLRDLFWHGLVIAAVGALALVAWFPMMQVLLGWLIDDAGMLELAQGYIEGVVLSAPALALYFALRNYFEGNSDTAPILVTGFLALALNIPLNALFIYGGLGIPAMGGAGCGWATGLVNWAMALSLSVHLLRASRYRKQALSLNATRIRWPLCAEIVRLGLPIASALFFEVTLFAAVTLLLADFGVVEVSSHQVATNISSLTFMLPLSLGVATAIRVGYTLGQRDYQQTLRVIDMSLLSAICMAIGSAVVISTGRFVIPALYTDAAEVVAMTAELLVLAALFQLVDAIQAVGSAIHRGLRDGRTIFWVTFVAYWLIGLTVGTALGRGWFFAPMGAKGFWIGLILGLTSAAIMYLVSLVRHRRQLQQRLS